MSERSSKPEPGLAEGWPDESEPEKPEPPVALQEATATTVRALAADAEVRVQFSNVSPNAPYEPQTEAEQIQLPNPSGDARQLQRFRGMADRQAFWRRFHDSALDARIQPTDVAPEVRQLWQRLEQVRVEIHGSRYLLGCRENMASCEQQEQRQEEASEAAQAICRPVATAALLRSMLAGQAPDDLSGDLQDGAVSGGAGDAAAALRQLADDTKEHLHDQSAFANRVLQFLKQMDWLPPEEQADEQDIPDEDQDPADGPEVASEQDSDDSMAEGDGEEGMEELTDSESSDAMADGELIEDEGDDAAGELSQLEQELLNRATTYKPYCRTYDRIVAASDLCSAAELRALRAQLDQFAQPCMGLVNKLAARLRHLIMAHQQRRWESDLEDGILDAKRLARVIASPLRIPPHRQERSQEFRSTVVSLLIDNSGSQRGKAIALAAVTAEIVASTLEKCGVRTEILGFTTSEWKGGQSRRQWKADGQPPSPGRLNDLLHIEYKAASTPWRRMRRDLGLMLQPELLKENIDGEALIWAHDRLLPLPEERRILMVISDGAPVDDSTLSTNAPGYLDMHLRQVIEGIERLGLVELIAIGIGHDVSRYYRHAVTLYRTEDLGTVVLEQLAGLFAHNKTGSAARRN